MNYAHMSMKSIIYELTLAFVKLYRYARVILCDFVWQIITFTTLNLVVYCNILPVWNEKTKCHFIPYIAMSEY